MPQIIEIPGQGRVEFPDGMSDAQIVQAIKRLSAPQPEPKEEGPGVLMSTLLGAGRATDRIVKGAQQLYHGATGNEAELARLRETVADEDKRFAPVRQAHPWAVGIGESLPALAVPIGGTGAAFVARSALAGAAPGALEYGTAEERMKRGALGAVGGAAGGLAGLGLGKLLKPSAAPAGINADAAQAAERLGVKLTAGQRTQNPALVNLENYLARSPGSSGTMQAQQAAQQAVLNTKAAGAMGQKGGDLSEAGFAAARDAIGAEFDRLGAVTKPQIGNDFMQTLAKVEQANIERGPFRVKAIDSLLDKSLDLAAKGSLTGKAYKEVRTALSNEAQSAFKGGDATLGQAIKAVRDSLDDAAKASLGKADQEAWDVARAQWAAYKSLSRSNVAEAGNVSPARLAATLRRGGDGFRAGRMNGDLADIARLGEAVKGSQNPNSGQLTGSLLERLLMAAPNRVGAGVYNSRPAQAYLVNGLVQNPTAVDLTRRAALPATLPVLPAFLGAE